MGHGREAHSIYCAFSSAEETTILAFIKAVHTVKTHIEMSHINFLNLLEDDMLAEWAQSLYTWF